MSIRPLLPFLSLMVSANAIPIGINTTALPTEEGMINPGQTHEHNLYNKNAYLVSKYRLFDLIAIN